MISRYFKNHRFILFVVIYGAFLVLNHQVAPHFGRVPLPCRGDVLQERSLVYCLLNRNYVTPELRGMLQDYAGDIEGKYHATITYTLDGSFPFTSMPLFPHLSHRDGKHVDLAFYYEYRGYDKAKTRSPIGYFAFEYPDMEECPQVWPSLRWNLRWAQGFWRDYELDDERMEFMVDWLDAHQSEYGIEKVFIEPHLAKRWGATSDLFRFQGCRATRHDDHVHVQIR